MLDFRVKTFLELCDAGSYTDAARRLNLTQPAVSQHIHHLEEEYGVKLLVYQGRELRLTEAGKRFREVAMSIRADDDRFRERLALSGGAIPPLRFGATLTIGEYTMPGILEKALEEFPDLRVSMQVKNTEELLNRLERGVVDFALVEGSFDRSRYETRLFSREGMLGVCAPEEDGMEIGISQLSQRRLIVREAGSGTRGVLEQALQAHNFNLNAFPQVVELGSMEAIKVLVAAGCGVSFLYGEAVKKELAQGMLGQFKVKGLSLVREFNFVSLKNSVHEAEHQLWFQRFCGWRIER